MRGAIDAKTAALNGVNPSFVVGLGDVVANPRCWRTLYKMAPANSVAERSEWLGDDILAGMVGKARKEAGQFVTANPDTLGHTVCFKPEVWFEPYRETAMLRAAWENAGPEHETAFPECFERSTPTDELAFCLRVAARQQVAATDMMRDPHCRQPDCVRSPNRGHGGKKSMMPPPPPLTASQRLLLARLKVAGMGAPLNRKIAGR